MKLFIQKNIFDNTYQIVEAAKSLDIETKLVKIDDFDQITLDHLDETDIVALGSVEFIQQGKRDLPVDPFAWYEDEVFDSLQLHTYYKDYILNKDFSFVPFGNLKDLKWQLFRTFARETEIFMRPNSGAKSFTGGTFDLVNFDSEIDAIKEETKISDRDLVLVSSVKNILAEFRLICFDNEIIGHSTYKYGGLLTEIKSVPKEVLDFWGLAVYDIGWIPQKFYTVDIVMDNNGVYHVLEFNCLNSSNWYAADVKSVLEKIKNNLSSIGEKTPRFS